MVEYPSAISRLFDLSLEIERSNDDRLFAKDPDQTINYVFDENIFELFAYPAQNRKGCQVFFGNSKTDRTSSIQSALVTAEILFSGQLPGQKDRKIFLTEWHRQELLDRMTEIIAGHRAQLLQIDRHTTAVRAKLSFWQATTDANARFDWLSSRSLASSDDHNLKGDIERLRSDGVAEQALKVFRATRETALSLGTDEFIEPSEQLYRLLSVELQSNLKGAVSLRRPDERATSQVGDRAKFWAQALHDEVRHQRTIARRKPKTIASIWNDAQSLALVEWISSQFDPNIERIVFVTGDSTVFDAYRRHWKTIPFKPMQTHPFFLLRSPVQYAPIFDAATTSPKHIDRDDLFYRVRQTVDLAVMPLKLAALASKRQRSSLFADPPSATLVPLRKRVEVKRKWGAAPTSLDTWIEQQQSGKWQLDVHELEADWRRAERILIGLASNLVKKRLNSEEIKLFEKSRTATVIEQEKLIVEHVRSTFRRISLSVLHALRPYAQRFFEQSLRSSAWVIGDRVPLAVRLRVTHGNQDVDLLGLLSSAGGRDQGKPFDERVPLLQNTFDVFVAASVMALLKREWRIASHFGFMATNAFEYLRREDKLSKLRGAEAYYVLALSRRFRLGQLDMSSGQNALRAAHRYYDEAIAALSYVKKYGLERSGLRKRDTQHFFKKFRVSSEKSALELSLALQVYLGNKYDRVALQSVREHLQQAEIALLLCLETQSQCGGDFFSLSSEDKAVALIKRQFLINIAACFVISRIVLDKPMAELISPLLVVELEIQLSDLSRIASDRLRSLFRAELLAFKISRGIDVVASNAQLNSLRLEDDGDSSLPMDAKLFDLVRKHFASPEHD